MQLLYHPTHSAWHQIPSGWLTCLLHVHDFRQPFLRYSDQELLFPGHRYGQLTMPNFNTTLPSAVIEFTCESPNTKHCLLNQPDKLIFCTLKDFSCLVVTFVLLPSLNEIYISRMSMTIFSFQCLNRAERLSYEALRMLCHIHFYAHVLICYCTYVTFVVIFKVYF